MTMPQVINLNEDSVVAVSGDDVLNESTGVAIDGGSFPMIKVDLHFLDLISMSKFEFTNKTMTWQANYNHWTIPVSFVYPGNYKNDRRKLICKVTKESSDPSNMREFKLSELGIDNEAIDRNGYEVMADGTLQSSIRWGDDENGDETYSSKLYRNGVGKIPPQRPSMVTHRGPVKPFTREIDIPEE